jgi:hypothetical protein
MKVGDQAGQITHPIQGEIIKKKHIEESDTFQYLLEYTDKHGEVTQRWFLEEEIELIGEGE